MGRGGFMGRADLSFMLWSALTVPIRRSVPACDRPRMSRSGARLRTRTAPRPYKRSHELEKATASPIERGNWRAGGSHEDHDDFWATTRAIDRNKAVYFDHHRVWIQRAVDTHWQRHR